MLVAAVLGLRTAVDVVPGARIALTAAAAAVALFALAHFYALIDADTAILLFSIFMIAASAALIVAGIAIARADLWSDAGRFVPLLCRSPRFPSLPPSATHRISSPSPDGACAGPPSD